ncbi:MAG: lipopolysaccharide heptosyltransferase II [Burkholderiales bacterium]|nr:lipopolysaccharide heptosyltransferase II [Burkholderiales bacterium]
MRRILVVAPNWIGDALMAQPLLARLRARHPEARIDALGLPWVAPVLRRMPEVDEVIEADFRHGALELGRRFRLARLLRARGYDCAFVLPNSWKSALAPFLAAIPERIGYTGEARYGLLNRRRRARGAPMAEHYAALADPPGEPAAAPLPKTVLRADPARASATAARFGIRGDYAVLCPGAEYGPAKRWPYFAELAPRLALPAVLVGSAKDADACAGIAALDLCGKTTLDEAIDLIAGARFVVANDSGLMHVAAALDRPLVAIFGSSSPLHTPPRSARARALWLSLECSPCFARVCPLGHLRCLREITVEQAARGAARARLRACGRFSATIAPRENRPCP